MDLRVVAIAPHPDLRPYVLSYRIVEDISGDYAGNPIWTCPEPIGVLSANFGKRSYHESGAVHPKIGLLGIQTHARKWISQPETSFVMAVLTVPGMMALFPNIGRDSADNLLDVAGIWGDREAGKFWHCFPHELRMNDVKRAMDTWFSNALGAVSLSARERFVQFHQALASSTRVDTACDRLGITPRTLQREFQRHLGISPKQITHLHRLQHSVRANVDVSLQSPSREFADQSHAIRAWNRYLNRTPGRYRAEDRSAIAKVFDSSTPQTSFDPTLFYL